jgi:phosphoribosylaminoimidazole-succinocarboxamide synthase
VDDAQIRTKCSARYGQAIEASFDKTFQITGEHVVMDASKGMVAPRLTGKVRDRYEFEQVMALVTTDRQSGFDRMLALVPFKGAVLNLTSAYWFETTKDIVPNHLISVPHPNVSIVKKCTPFPIEFVVR